MARTGGGGGRQWGHEGREGWIEGGRHGGKEGQTKQKEERNKLSLSGE